MPCLRSRGKKGGFIQSPKLELMEAFHVMFLEQPFCLATGVAFNLLSDVIPGLALRRKPGVSYNDFQKKIKVKK